MEKVCSQCGIDISKIAVLVTMLNVARFNAAETNG